MTTLLEPPTILDIGKPPNIFEGDAPAPPAESVEDETEDEALEEEEGI
ncbi:MAG TPA: hypothetical protein VGT98_07655 [Candidatus Elarobacter sp.]|nr:hypothetical protein [Candidatus Elarobacter sp.]